MSLLPEIIAGTSSTLTRIGAYVFLRWIPGHHFPPFIFTSLAIYLTCVFGWSDAFGSSRLHLHEAFPNLFRKLKIHKPNGVQEVEVPKRGDESHEDPFMYEDEKVIFKTLLLGIPNWRESDYSYLTILVNIILALFTMDMVFRGPLLHPEQDLRFSRVGFVDSTSAKVLFREPDSSQLPVYAYLKSSGAADWTTTDPTYYLDADTDYTHPLEFTGLSSDTSYEYVLSNNLSGTFKTDSSSHSLQANSLTFLTSSCIKANFPYNPFSNALAIHGFKDLSKIIGSLTSPPSFMLFLGDFIYVDVPQRISSTMAHYRSEYRRVYASPSWSLPGLSSLPWYHTLDDHEIANDWSGGNDTEPFPSASDPFIHYHVSVNPPLPPSAPTGPDTNTTYFQFIKGPASFFMLDTRRYRTDPEPQSSSAAFTKPETNHTMLGAAQLSSLLHFLSQPEPHGVHWKIIASSVPFTKNWRFGTFDSWGGFLHERSLILNAMHAAERDLGVRVIILSGDRHEFAAIRFPPPILNLPPPPHSSSSLHSPIEEAKNRVVYDRTPTSGPHEFSVGPLSMFYLPIRTFKQIDEEDVAIKYLPDGNSKVGVVELTNLGGGRVGGVGGDGRTANAGTRGKEEIGQRSLFKYSLYINGEVAWEYSLTSPAPAYEGGKTVRGTRKFGWL